MNSFHIYAFIKQVAIVFPSLIIIFTVHGFFKAAAAYLVGDDTPREEGFLTLNPLAHADVLGSLVLAGIIVMVSTSFSSYGFFAILACMALARAVGLQPYYPVPVDPSSFRWPRVGIVVTTLASTFSYLFLALLSMYTLLIGFDLCGGLTPTYLIIQQVASAVIEWSMVWATLSLIPIPPFESAVLLPVFFGEVGQRIYDFLEPYGLLILMVCLGVPGIREVFIDGINVVNLVLYQGLTKLIFI